ncbi:hypothetical protein DLM75_13250 [Leptospira stimsonii]|uniref:Uncharacterized protein n=1 Tax=Leptospira stimsonii TaxID=2202203 RepID=A0A396Z730_9LEPT|nr:hypothetical protein DLM75_13250 [Leptospira stimsonii]
MKSCFVIKENFPSFPASPPPPPDQGGGARFLQKGRGSSDRENFPNFRLLSLFLSFLSVSPSPISKFYRT